MVGSLTLLPRLRSSRFGSGQAQAAFAAPKPAWIGLSSRRRCSRISDEPRGHTTREQGDLMATCVELARDRGA